MMVTRRIKAARSLHAYLFMVSFAAIVPFAETAVRPASAEAGQGGHPSGIEGAPGPSTTFLETFDGRPTNPQPWNARDWDVFQTSRDVRSWANPDPVDAHHAFQNCGDVATGGSHRIRTWPETVFKCNDHVMTSINGEPGYAAIYLSPPAMADFSNGPSTVGFDVSTFVSSSRDWLDVLITPFADAMSYPFRSDLDVDGSGLPRNAIHIEQTFGSDLWEIELIRNNVVQTLGSLRIPYDRIGGASKVTRTPVRIVIAATSITLSYPTISGASATVRFAALDWNQGIVQLGHHSYTPLKDCEFTPGLVCAANTWHWDNVRISPARRFYQWQATPERTGAAIYDSNPRSISFGKPAPANATLVFSGNCGVQVRDSSTSPWRAATIIANQNVEHTQSYRVSVRQGSTGLQFRFVANGWYGPGYGCQLSNPIVKSLLQPVGTQLFTWDLESGAWAVRSMSGWQFQLQSSGNWHPAYDDVVAGDFDRDGSSDDLFVWDRTSGKWAVQSIVNGVPNYRWQGLWGRGYDEVIVGDFDGDGYFNDLFVWDHDTGKWQIWSVTGFRPTYRRSGSYHRNYDTIVVGDWDGDGRRDDSFIWDTTTGFWVVHSFSAFTGTFRNSGRWSSAFDRAYAGDWNADGRRNDMLVWDDQTGAVGVQSWTAFKPTYRGRFTFSSTIDLATAADLDNDGRWNELFVFDRDAYQWQVHRWLAFRPAVARAGTWTVGYDIALG